MAGPVLNGLLSSKLGAGTQALNIGGNLLAAKLNLAGKALELVPRAMSAKLNLISDVLGATRSSGGLGNFLGSLNQPPLSKGSFSQIG